MNNNENNFSVIPEPQKKTPTIVMPLAIGIVILTVLIYFFSKNNQSRIVPDNLTREEKTDILNKTSEIQYPTSTLSSSDKYKILNNK